MQFINYSKFIYSAVFAVNLLSCKLQQKLVQNLYMEIKYSMFCLIKYCFSIILNLPSRHFIFLFKISILFTIWGYSPREVIFKIFSIFSLSYFIFAFWMKNNLISQRALRDWIQTLNLIFSNIKLML